MGTGFTLGPLVGGLSAKAWGYATSFYLSSGFAFCALMLLFLLPDINRENDMNRYRGGLLEGFRDVLRNPSLVAAGVATFFNSMLYSATMVYFPLYGKEVGFDESQVGMGLTVRGMVSTATRLPTGAAIMRLGAFRLMIVGLGVSAITIMALPAFESLLLISVILGIQGIAFGIYLTSGNVFVTEEAPEGMKGAAIGAYSTFSNVSGVISPILLGTISARWGIRPSFRVAAVLSLVGIAATLVYTKKRAQQLDPLKTP
jgi:predicted MFS family arabinose efflux permease